MNRRLVLGAAAAAAPAALAAPALAQSNPEVRWRFQSSFPRNLDVLFGTAERVAAKVAALTEGRFRITAFPAGEIVPGLQVLDAVQAGTIECGHTASYWYIGKEPGFAFFTAIPFGLNTRQLTAWLRHGGGNQMADQLFAEYNIQAFPCGDTGAQMGGWFRQEIRTPQDVQGLKFRISGLAGQVFQRMGASPTLVAPADIYPSLERGTIDATEFVGPHDDERLGFFRVARFYYAPGWFEPAARLHFMSNKRAYDALPQQYKEALMIACSDADAEMVSRYDHLNPIALRRLVAQGTQLRFYSREILQLAWRSNEALMADLAGQNQRFRTIWDSYRPYRAEEFQWFRVSENSYDNFAFAAAQAGGG
jgi:TRAP-type mannitol/chloroaromatic compound transport system substrate-binding protein